MIEEILQHKSLAIVGMAKNTGKTTCLNYVLDRLSREHPELRLALTSIGVDGEARDVLYDTPKPPIHLRKGQVFLTSQEHYEQRDLQARILKTSARHTALGPLITAEVIEEGNIILSGPSDTPWLLSEMQDVRTTLGCDLFIIDGALSRLSLASPAVSESLILTTGAAVSIHLEEVIRRTQHLCRLIDLPLCDTAASETFVRLSAFAPPPPQLLDLRTIALTGALTENFLATLAASPKVAQYHLLISDFTRCFASPMTLDKFLRRGGQLQVAHKAQLIGICCNPTHPEGYHFEPTYFQQSLQNALGRPVFDIKGGASLRDD